MKYLIFNAVIIIVFLYFIMAAIGANEIRKQQLIETKLHIEVLTIQLERLAD